MTKEQMYLINQLLYSVQCLASCKELSVAELDPDTADTLEDILYLATTIEEVITDPYLLEG